MTDNQIFPPIIDNSVECPQCGKRFSIERDTCPTIPLTAMGGFGFGEVVGCDWVNPYATMTVEERDAFSNMTVEELAAASEERKAKILGIQKSEIEEAKNTGDWSAISPEIINENASDIVLTTSFYLANQTIDREIEVLTAECVFGMNMFRDMFAGIRDIVGGRSAATQKVLRDARRTAMTELRREALMVGADAVIGIDLDYQELSGGGKSGMLMIVASGTAVAVKKKDDANDGS